MEEIARIGGVPGDSALRGARSVLAAQGLELTPGEWAEIVEERRLSLARVERLEVGEPAIALIAEAFADSPEVTRENLASTLIQIQEAFYDVRDEADPEISDEEIVWSMREAFDGIACGQAEDAAELALLMLAIASAENESDRAVDHSSGVWRNVLEDDGWDENLLAPGWLGERWEDD